MPKASDGKSAVRVCVYCTLLFAQSPHSRAADGPDEAAAECTPPQGDVRRRPGAPEASAYSSPCDPHRLASPDARELPAPQRVPDRWRLVEALGYADNRLDPYGGNNPLKGDRPIFGSDIFASLSASSSTLFEPRRVPVAAGNSADQLLMSENAAFDAVLYKGDTVFRPPDYLFRFSPVVNYARTSQRAGGTATTTSALSIQSLFAEFHLRDVSAQYDFDSMRVGIQPMTSDFRGFLLLDQPAGVRLFGTRSNNRYQYNLGWFRPLAKNSARLNDIGTTPPSEDILVANLYRQDLFTPGFTAELVMLYDRNRVPVTRVTAALDAGGSPSVVADRMRHAVVVYVGSSGDGHFGRFNVTGAFYYALGTERAGDIAASRHVRASFAALELSRDFDGIRLRLSALNASGDADPDDQRGTAFTTFNSTPLFAGADGTFFFHQRLPLTAAADLKQRDRLVPDLRANGAGSSSSLGPGLRLVGVGADFDLSPRLRLSVDANELWFAELAPLAAVTGQTPVSRRIGSDFSVDAFFRPLDTQNLIVRFSAASLGAARGYRDLYGEGAPLSLLVNLVVAY